MATMRAFVGVLLCLGASLCTLQGAESLSIPPLPTSFSVEAEFTFENGNMTFDVAEYVDATKQLSRFEWHSHGHHEIYINDVPGDVSYHIEDRTCTTTALRAGQDNCLWHEHGEHLGRLESLFDWATASTAWTQEATQREVRGITCDCYTQLETITAADGCNAHSVTFQFCFAKAGWHFSAHEDTMAGTGMMMRDLVRITMQGTETRGGVDRVIDSEIHFTNFVPGAPSRWTWQAPDWIFCPAKVQRPVPDQIPDSFEVVMQRTDAQENETHTLKEFRDFDKNKVRLETFRHDHHDVEIYDVDNLLHFTIRGHHCTVADLTVDNQNSGVNRFVSVNVSAHHLIHNTFDNAKDAVYGGTVHELNVLCHHYRLNGSWTNSENTGRADYRGHLYYAHEDWKFGGQHNLTNVPVMMRWRGTWNNFSTGETKDFNMEIIFVGLRRGRISPMQFEIPPQCHGQNKNVQCNELNEEDCADINREPCGANNGPDNQCGPCRPGFHGLSGNGNTLCTVRADFAARTQKPLPILPDEFSASIEANIVEKDYTIEIKEYYDYENNRLRLENHRNNRSVIEIWDFQRNTYHNVSGYRCDTAAISDLNRSRANMFFAHDSGHLRRARDLYEGTADMNWEYGGVTRARGIECDHWRASHSEQNERGSISYTLEWAFAEEEWQFRGFQQTAFRTPVRLTLNGSMTFTNGYTQNFLHYYDWISFDATRPAWSVFRLDDDIFCPALIQKKPPTYYADDFEVVIEMNDHVEHKTTVFKEYYDYDQNKARIETFSDGQHQVNLYNADDLIHYSLAGNKGTEQCTFQKLTEDNVGSGTNQYLYQQLNVSAHHLMHMTFKEANNSVYGGHTLKRDIWCDNYFLEGEYSDDNVEYDYHGHLYYAADHWTLDGEPGTKNYPVSQEFHGRWLNKSTGEWKRFAMEFVFTGYITGRTDPAMYEIPPACAGLNPAVQCDMITGGNCANLNRQPCGAANGPANTCGPCLKGYFGVSGHHNTLCAMPAPPLGTAGSATPELPLLSDEYSATIEANILERDYTVTIKEYYDVRNNRLRLENHRHNRSVVEVWDYNADTFYNLTGEWHCETQRISTLHTRDNMFFSSESGHLRRASDLYERTKELTWTYRGFARARGIECEHWTATFANSSAFGTIEYTLEWFFARGTWSQRGYSSAYRTPVRLALNGTMMFGGRHYNFQHNYDWVEYVPRRPGREVFQFDDRVFCPAVTQKPFTAKLPDFFSATLEISASDFTRAGRDRGATWSGKEYYDSQLKKARLETRWNSTWEMEIYDLNTNQHFHIQENGKPQDRCHVTSLSEGPTPFTRWQGSAHFLLPILGQGDFSAMPVYGGTREIRDIQCDRWRTHGVKRLPYMHNAWFNYTADWYFAVPTWTEWTDREEPAPIVEVVMFGTWTEDDHDEQGHTERHFLEQTISYSDVSFRRTWAPLYDIPQQCFGAVPGVTCDRKKLTPADCTVLSRQPCGVGGAGQAKDNMCGPCVGAFAAKDPAETTGSGMSQCLPVGNGFFDFGEQEATSSTSAGVITGTAIGAFLGGLGLGLLVYWCGTKAKRGYFQFAASSSGALAAPEDTAGAVEMSDEI